MKFNHHSLCAAGSETRRWTARTSCVVALAALVLVGPACKREQRSFPAGPVSTSTPAEQDVRLSSLQPGVPTPSKGTKNDYEENAYAMSEGKRLFSSFNCSGCHANGGGDKGPALMDAKWIYGSRPEQVFASIMEGRPNGMPSFRGKLPEHMAWQITAYVRSLSGQVPAHAATQRNEHMKTNPPENSVDPVKPENAGSPH
jgi:cytochrome c oxidase cbb3-type subunit 3